MFDHKEDAFHPVDENVEITTPVQLNIFIPESLVTSDINLSKLAIGDADGGKKKFLDTEFYLSDLFWFIQYKESTSSYRDEKIKLDKFLLRLRYGIDNGGGVLEPQTEYWKPRPKNEFYALTDLFFDPSTSYTAKALGVYSSISKVSGVNYKYNGELHAERRDIPWKNWNNNIFIIPDSVKLEKRARAMFAYLELTTVLL